MKFLILIDFLRRAIFGEPLERTVVRNAKAADELDRAVKEMLGK